MEENINEIKKGGLNRTWLLVSGLVALTIVLLVVSLKTNTLPSLPGVKQQVKTDFAHTSLSISEDVRESTSSGIYETDVFIDTDKDKVAGVQLEIAYDPKVLQNVDIKPGDFIADPVTVIKRVDSKTGRITFALATKPQAQAAEGQGIIAVLSFRKSGTGPTIVSFLPQTQVASPGSSQSVLRQTFSAQITLPADSQAIISPLRTSPTQ